MKFSVLFWNIWLDNQIKGKDNASALLTELKLVCDKYAPDCIGLNELLKHRDAENPFVLEYLKKLGYKYIHFAAASPLTNQWTIGAGVASKYRLGSLQEISISKDIAAEKRGYMGCEVKAITTQLALTDNKTVNFIVAHPLHLQPYSREAHYEAVNSLLALMRKPEFSSCTILGGDFNESIHWPKSFKRATHTFLNHKTGTLMHPTWLYNASKYTPFRVNLDQLYWTKDKELTLNKFEVIPNYISDHRPLWANFYIR